MKTGKIIFRTLSVLVVMFLIVVGFSIFNTYKKIAPFLNDLNATGDKIEHHQQLTDSILILYDKNEKQLQVSLLGKRKIIHFWDFKNMFCQREIPILENYYGGNLKGSQLLIVSLNNRKELNEFLILKEINFQVFRIDTAKMPLKHKKIIFPYTIETENGKIIKSYLGKIKL